MHIYKVQADLTVTELNAKVLYSTFPFAKGVFEADLYSGVYSSSKLVYKGSCAPTNQTFVKTVTIKL